nr:GNAT family N-acetyltransferase [Pseudomonas syringae]
MSMPETETRPVVLTPTLHTPRLLLLPLQLEDAPAMQSLFNHWEVVRYLTHHMPWPYPEGEALRYLRHDAGTAMGIDARRMAGK